MNNLSTIIKPQLPARIEDLQKFVLVGREKLISVRAEIRAIEKLELATGVREQKQEEAQFLASALLDAEARIGEITKKIPPAQGKRTDKELIITADNKSKKEILKDIGLTELQANRFEILAENPDIIEEVKQEAIENDDLPTRTEVLKRVKEREEKENKLKIIESIRELSPINGLYDVIVIDPPWTYDNRASDTTHRARNIYPSMTIEEIKVLKIPTTENCVIWLWTTNAFMHEAYHVLEAWKFTPKTILTWIKDRMGLGDWLRGQTEHCIMAVKGRPVINLTNQTTVINGELREHSRKPDEFYEMVKILCPGRRLEMFSREAREGFDARGAEIDKF